MHLCNQSVGQVISLAEVSLPRWTAVLATPSSGIGYPAVWGDWLCEHPPRPLLPLGLVGVQPLEPQGALRVPAHQLAPAAPQVALCVVPLYYLVLQQDVFAPVALQSAACGRGSRAPAHTRSGAPPCASPPAQRLRRHLGPALPMISPLHVRRGHRPFPASRAHFPCGESQMAIHAHQSRP